MSSRTSTLLSLLLLLFALPACHRGRNGQANQVPLAIAAAVLGGGRVVLDPGATTQLLLGTLLLQNTLAATATEAIRFRLPEVDGYSAEDDEVVLRPGEQRIVNLYTRLATAALLTYVVYATWDVGGEEREYPITWQNEAANSNALALARLMGAAQLAVLWYASAVLSPIGLLVRNSNPMVPQRVPTLITEIRLLGAICAFFTLLELEAMWGQNDSGVAFPPGQGPNGFTVAATPALPSAAGNHIAFWLSVQGDIPIADPARRYQYAFVVDSDAIPANNYVPAPAFPDDFFANTDRWYELTYTPAQGWQLQCKVARAGSPIQVVASGAHAVLRGDTLLMLVPSSEFQVTNPPFRASTFEHAGDFGQNPPYDWAGDPTPPVAEGLQTWQ